MKIEVIRMLAMPSSRYIFGVIPWYSTLIVTGIVLALCHCYREEKRLGLPQDTVTDLALLLIPCGIIGARLYYVVFAWDSFASNPLSAFKIWEGGLAIYGGVIGGLLAMLVFSRWRKIPLFTLTDMVAPGLALAQAIGRWGNYFNMEAYGEVITNPALQFFPVGVLIPQGQTQVWHMATFFYESMWNLMIFLVLYRLRTRIHRRGDVSLFYFLLYGAGRFVIEGLRMDSLMSGTLRVSQLLSLGLCVLMLGVLCFRGIRLHRRQTLIWSAVCLGLTAGVIVSPLSPIWKHILIALTAILISIPLYQQTKLEESTCRPRP